MRRRIRVPGPLFILIEAWQRWEEPPPVDGGLAGHVEHEGRTHL